MTPDDGLCIGTSTRGRCSVLVLSAVIIMGASTLSVSGELAETGNNLVERARTDPLACALLLAVTSDFPMRPHAMAVVGRTYWNTGEKERGLEALNRALEAARSSEEGRDQHVAAVAWAYAESGIFEKALDAALYVGAEDYRKALIDNISAEQADREDPDADPPVSEPHRHDSFWYRKAMEKAEEGDFRTALSRASLLLNLGFRSWVLSTVVRKAAGKVDEDMLALVLEEARDSCINSGLGRYGRAWCLAGISNAYAGLGRPAYAQEALKQAVEAARKPKDPLEAETELGNVALILSQAGRAMKAHEIMSSLRHPRLRAETFARAAAAIAEQGNVKEAGRWLTEAAEALERAPDGPESLPARIAMVEGYAAVGDMQTALRMAAGFKDPSSRALALISVGRTVLESSVSLSGPAKALLSRMVEDALGD